MKKTRLLALLLVFCLALPTFAITGLADDADITQIPATEALKGDANDDGTVDTKDVIVMRRYLADLDYTTGMSSIDISLKADMDGDGDVRLYDLYLLRYYVVNGKLEDPTETETGAHVHSYGNWAIIKNATCTSEGEQERYCECGDVDKQTIPAKGHVKVYHDAKAPTETEIGWEAYETCENCDYSTYVELPATHTHSWENKVVPATCKEQGYTLRTCSCGSSEKVDYTAIDLTKHIWGEPVEDNRASCLENGYIVRICSVCGDTDREPESALGHKWVSATCTEAQYCEICKAQGEAALGHKFGETPISQIAPKCETTGSNTYQCTRSGCTEQTTETIAATGHLNVTWNADVDEVLIDGCRYKNVTTGICTDCSASVSRDSDPFFKHSEQVAITNATCVAEGNKVYTCSNCGEKLREEIIPVDPTAHKWNDGTDSADGSATTFECTAEGCIATKVKYNENKATLNVKEVDAVEVNGATISPDEKTKEALGDSVTLSVDTKTANDIEGIDEELKERIGESTVYDLSMTAGDDAVSQFEGKITVRVPYTLEEGEDPENIVVWFINDNGEVEPIPATYEDGSAVFTTEHFSYYTVTRMTPEERCKLYGHNFVGDSDVTVVLDGKEMTVKGTKIPATCVSGGYDIIFCARCAKRETNLNPTEALGHDWSITDPKKATCTETGVKRYECNRCDVNFEEIVNAFGHDWHPEEEDRDGYNGKKDRYKKPSCTEKGEHYIICANCSEEYKEEIAQTGHDYDDTVIEPTCEKHGYTNHKCNACKSEYNSDQKNAHGHIWDKFGHCSHCGKDCKHKFENGVCHHCGALENVIYPEPESEVTAVLVDNENQKVILTVYYDDNGAIVKVKYTEKWYYYDSATSNGQIRTETYVVEGSVYEYYIVDKTSMLNTFSAGENWIGHEVAGVPTVSGIEGTATRIVIPNGEDWIVEDLEEKIIYTALDESEKNVIYFYQDSETKQITATGHTDGKSVYDESVEEKTDPVYGDVIVVTETRIVYCEVCGGEAHKSVEITVTDEYENIYEMIEREYIMVDGVETCVYETIVKGAVFESTVIEGETYNMGISQEGVRYLVNGDVFMEGTMEVILGKYNCQMTIRTIVDGELVSEETYVEHYNYSLDIKLAEGSKNCTDGVVHNYICLACGEENQKYSYYHMYNDEAKETVDLSEYGCEHAGRIEVRQCLCGDRTSVEILDDECAYSYNYSNYEEAVTDETGKVIGWIWHQIETRICDECNNTIKIDRYTTNDNCHGISHEVYTINDTIVYDSVRDEGSSHDTRWESIPEESFEKIVDGKLELTFAYSVICERCGQYFGKNYEIVTYNDEAGSYEIWREDRNYVPHGDKLVLDTVYVYEYARSTGKLYTDCEFSYVTKETVYHYSPEDSDTPIYTETCVYVYDEENRCGEITVIYSDSNGDTHTTTQYIDHIYTEFTYALTNPEGNCEDGIDRIRFCPDCGELDRWIYTYGHMDTYRKEYSLNDYGHTCGGYIYENACLCGEYSWHGLNLPSYSSTSTGKIVDGIYHRIITYTCDDGCNGTIERETWEEKDEYCNTVSYNVYSVGGIVIYENVKNNGQQHNETTKEYPDECTDVTDEITGIRTVTIVREHYCEDCKASLRKTVLVDIYNKEGYLVKEEISYYRFEAIDAETTISVLERVECYEYGTAQCSYDNSYTRKYLALRTVTYYDENGNESDWERCEYRYDGDNYCSATVTYTNAYGGKDTYTEEMSHTDETKSVYRLSEGAIYCTDGVREYAVCYDCGEEIEWSEWYGRSHFSNGNEITRIDLAQYGSVCGSEFVAYECVCGYGQVVKFEGLCEYTVQDGYYFGDGQSFHSYACPVNEPEKCGFSYTVHVREYADGDCNGYWNYVYYFGVSEEEETNGPKYEFSAVMGSKKHHIETEKVSNENGYVESSKCTVCGTVSEEISVENYEYTRVHYNYRENGTLSSKQINSGLMFYSWYNWYNDPLETSYRLEYYDESGSLTWWHGCRYEYPYADEGNYCYRITIECDRDNPDGVVIEEGVNHRVMSYSSGDVGCVPGTEYYVRCDWCGGYEIRTDDSNGHRYYWDDELGLYVCNKCGLESDTGRNGDVIFADYTLTESNGENKYIVGYRNYFGGDFTWRVSLIVPIAGEDDYDQIVLPDIQPELVGEYRLYIDADVIAEEAAKCGLENCEYMVRVTFVPTGNESQLDFAITLDPHIFVINEGLSNIVEDQCNEKGSYVYDCALCGEIGVKEKTYGGSHDWDAIDCFEVKVNADNNQECINKYDTICQVCGETTHSISIYTYKPDGSQISWCREEFDTEGQKISRTVYKYIYSPDGEEYTSFERRDDFSENYWYEHEYEYDFENQIRTCTYTNSNGEKNVEVYNMEHGYIISRTEINEYGERTYEHVWFEGNLYITFEKYYRYSDNYWYEHEYEYDFDNQIRTYTYTNSRGEKTVEVYNIEYGYTISRTEFYEDDEYTYEYIWVDGISYITYERYDRYSDEYWYQREYEYDFDNQLGTQTYTNSYGEKIVSTYDVQYGYTFSKIYYNSDGDIYQQNTHKYERFGNNSYIVFEKYERPLENYWYQYEYSYDFENGICTVTFTNSNGETSTDERQM